MMDTCGDFKLKFMAVINKMPISGDLWLSKFSESLDCGDYL